MTKNKKFVTEIGDELMKYLKKNRIVGKFRANVAKEHKDKSRIDSLYSAFTWSDSNEGAEFWVNHNSNFNKIR